MIKRLLLFFIVLITCTSFAQKARIQAVFDYKQFNTPYGAPYIETYLSFIASSLHYAPNDRGQLQSNIMVTQIFKRDNQIIDFKKYEVLGPELIDSVAVGFTDQKRFQLQPGVYTMDIQLMDLNDPDSLYNSSTQLISVNEFKDNISVSDIEFIDYYKKTEQKNEFSKSGFDLYPLVSNYLSDDIEKLAYYFEIYERDSSDNDYLVTQYIEDYQTKDILGKFIKRKKMKLEKVKPMINIFNIKKLVSGNYNLVVEIRDSQNQLMAIKKIFFQRLNTSYKVDEEIVEQVSFNDVVSADSLDYYMTYLLPIATEVERGVILSKKEGLTDQMKMNYFYTFWSKRDQTNPKGAWEAYRKKVEEVDVVYATRRTRGYETDRGRVEIKYGKPNNVVKRPNSNGQYPYEIWHYYHLENSNDVVFVFYQPQVIRQDYELLHSDLPGEIKNTNWKSFLNVNPSVMDNAGIDIETGR